MKKRIIMITILSFFFLSLNIKVFAEETDGSTYNKVEEVPTFTMDHENNYAMIKKGNTYVGIWTKIELNTEQQNELVSFIKEKDKSFKKQTPLFYYGYGEHNIANFGTYNFEFTEEGIKISAIEDSASHINYGISSLMSLGNLKIEVQDNTTETEKTTFYFTIKIEDEIDDGIYGDAEFTNGIANIQIDSGAKKYLLNLPAGISYTIYDSETNKELVRYENKEGMIPKNSEVIAVFVYGNNTENNENNENNEENKENEENKDNEETNNIEEEIPNIKNPITKDSMNLLIIIGIIISAATILLIIKNKKIAHKNYTK